MRARATLRERRERRGAVWRGAVRCAARRRPSHQPPAALSRGFPFSERVRARAGHIPGQRPWAAAAAGGGGERLDCDDLPLPFLDCDEDFVPSQALAAQLIAAAGPSALGSPHAGPSTSSGRPLRSGVRHAPAAVPAAPTGSPMTAAPTRGPEAALLCFIEGTNFASVDDRRFVTFKQATAEGVQHTTHKSIMKDAINSCGLTVKLTSAFDLLAHFMLSLKKLAGEVVRTESTGRRRQLVRALPRRPIRHACVTERCAAGLAPASLPAAPGLTSRRLRRLPASLQACEHWARFHGDKGRLLFFKELPPTLSEAAADALAAAAASYGERALGGAAAGGAEARAPAGDAAGPSTARAGDAAVLAARATAPAPSLAAGAAGPSTSRAPHAAAPAAGAKGLKRGAAAAAAALEGRPPARKRQALNGPDPAAAGPSTLRGAAAQRQDDEVSTERALVEMHMQLFEDQARVQREAAAARAAADAEAAAATAAEAAAVARRETAVAAAAEAARHAEEETAKATKARSLLELVVKRARSSSPVRTAKEMLRRT